MIPQEEKQSVCAHTHTHTHSPRIWKRLFYLFFTLKNFSFSLSIIGEAVASIRGRSDNVFALSSIGLKIQDLKRFQFKRISPQLVFVNFMDENTQRQRERGKWKEERNHFVATIWCSFAGQLDSTERAKAATRSSSDSYYYCDIFSSSFSFSLGLFLLCCWSMKTKASRLFAISDDACNSPSSAVSSAVWTLLNGC